MWKWKYALLACVLLHLTYGSKVVDRSLERSLKLHGSANILITIQDGAQPVLQNLKSTVFTTRESRQNGVVSALKQYAEQSQKPVKVFLEANKIPIDAFFWITNQILVKDTNTQIVQALSELPSVSQIRENGVIDLDVDTQSVASSKSFAEVEPGVELIRAPEAWALPGGNNGTGAVVGTLDVGVRVTHEALADNFVGDYGWFDPYTGSDKPSDEVGLGTHSIGVMAGQNGIGIAPGAKWMSCKGCQMVACTESALIACGQFMACPTRPNGQDPDCTKAPHVVSNSWGGGQSTPWFEDVIQAWIAAGIVPVFTSGGSGGGCGSVFVPANGVLSIGITTHDDTLSERSTYGPGPNGEIKPDLCAPGDFVRSAGADSDDSYIVMSGSTMSAAHVAGTIALLKAEDPNLSIPEVSSHLFSGANQNLAPTGKDCGGISETIFPNNAYGYGRVDAYEALLSLISSKRS